MNGGELRSRSVRARWCSADPMHRFQRKKGRRERLECASPCRSGGSLQIGVSVVDLALRGGRSMGWGWELLLVVVVGGER